MKRTVALWAAVCVSIGILSTSAVAQTPPPPESASGDTLKTTEPPQTPPAAAPKAVEAPDTLAAGARARRARAGDDRLSIVISLGLGSAINHAPDSHIGRFDEQTGAFDELTGSFTGDFNPSFGGLLSVGARRYGVTAALTFDYNFFLADGTIPNDLSVFMIFADLRYTPVHSTARPYVLVCGGYYRQWVVDLDYTENVLGYGGGVGVEMEVDKTRRVFLEGRYVQGRTRENETKANTEVIPFRLGISWEIK